MDPYGAGMKPALVIDNGTGCVPPPLTASCSTTGPAARSQPLPPRSLPLVPQSSRRYTKMGYAGNQTPSYVIPTVVGTDEKAEPSRGKMDDLDFFVGDDVRAPCFLCVACRPSPCCSVPRLSLVHGVHADCCVRALVVVALRMPHALSSALAVAVPIRLVPPLLAAPAPRTISA